MTRQEALDAALGPGAEPTGHLRLVTDGRNGRLQQNWRGPRGEAWVDVPIVETPVLPQRWPAETDPNEVRN